MPALRTIERIAHKIPATVMLDALAGASRCAYVGGALVTNAKTEGNLLRIDLATSAIDTHTLRESTHSGDPLHLCSLALASPDLLLAASLDDAYLYGFDASGLPIVQGEWPLQSASASGTSIAVGADASGRVRVAVACEYLLALLPDNESLVVEDAARPFAKACVSPRGDVIATGRRDGSVEIRDAKTLAVRRTLVGLEATVLAMAFSPDGTRLAAADDRTRARVWDIASGDGRALDGVAKIVRFAWLSDGSGVIAFSLTRHLAGWDMRDVRERGRRASICTSTNSRSATSSMVR